MPTRLLTAAAMCLILAAVSLGHAAPAGEQTTAKDNHADAEQRPHNTAPAGWTALFDGESLAGWTPYSGKAHYHVEDGAIVGTTEAGSPNTFLSTLRTFDNFELTFEVLLHDNALNSGCMIRSKTVREGKYGGRIGGPQVEIEAGPGQSGYIYGEAAGGWQSPEPKSKDRAVSTHDHFKNGQWNHYRVLAVGNRIQTWINGNPVADLTLTDDFHSKFTEGMIGLQVHGVGNRGPFSVRWRNIYIREADAE